MPSGKNLYMRVSPSLLKLIILSGRERYRTKSVFYRLDKCICPLGACTRDLYFFRLESGWGFQDSRYLGLLPLAQAIGGGAESQKGREQKATYFRAFEISFGSGPFLGEKVPPNLGGFLSFFAAPPERSPAIVCNAF